MLSLKGELKDFFANLQAWNKQSFKIELRLFKGSKLVAPKVTRKICSVSKNGIFWRASILDIMLNTKLWLYASCNKTIINGNRLTLPLSFWGFGLMVYAGAYRDIQR